LVFETGGAIRAEALFLEYREASGEILTPEVFPRADGTTWVCAISTIGPLPVDPADVAADEGAHARLEALCRNISPALAAAPIKAWQACFRPVTEDGLPFIGAVPGVDGAYVATGHSVWGMLNAPATGEAMSELILDWSATPGQNVPQNAVSNRPYSGCNVILLWLTRGRGWPTPRFLTFKQAQEAGGSVRKGEHGTKVYYWKQLRIEAEGESEAERLVPLMREYTVFNVAQCEGLPASVVDGKPARVRNPDTRDAIADEFLNSIGADIREGAGEAYYAPGQDFISLPAFAAFRGADHFHNVAFHELAHWTGTRRGLIGT
jgi:hypothetical protein